MCDDKKDTKTYSVNALNHIFGKLNEYFEEINGNKYIMLVLTNENKEKVENMENFGVKS